MEPLAVDIREAARLTSLSPHTIRWYARTGRIRSVRCGRRILIPVEALRELSRHGLPPQPPQSPTPQRQGEESWK